MRNNGGEEKRERVRYKNQLCKIRNRNGEQNRKKREL